MRLSQIDGGRVFVTLKTATSLSTARAKASSPEILKSYFRLLDETLKKHGLTTDPSLIFNMDESGFPLDPKVYLLKAQRTPAR